MALERYAGVGPVVMSSRIPPWSSYKSKQTAMQTSMETHANMVYVVYSEGRGSNMDLRE
ncbi:hypothetical protein RvY_08722 [Ramazzottius varieornatus]|uniref:Uncharacterized protein n=1 Tax=Ramazzottius varieornatus TaxID=947166 RepID=A0A1D1V937_RAMVA|nr:hypothetical protein RvY_08722 [Ramazzottius varieornatus]